jgi:UDP-2-acetamido-3-amino-2,3-dideoxy-glucuronate N-acetyltransferase
MSKPFIHASALCETTNIGEGTRIWAFAHILPGARVGRECNICDNTFIENDVVIGDRVTIKCGVQLWDRTVVEDDVFIGPNATFTNDPFPRSKRPPQSFSRTTIRRRASIGANATILPGIEIGPDAMIGAGAVVINNVPANAIVVGNPGRICGYVQSIPSGDLLSPLQSRTVAESRLQPSTATPIGVGNCSLHQLRFVKDMRGDLSVGEFERDVPFIPKRYFLTFDVPTREVRGEHAHKECHQFLICIRGSCQLLLDDGQYRREITLDRPDLGVYLSPMIWGTQHSYSPDGMLLVFASSYYDPEDYIRSYDEFRAVTLNALGKS